MDDSRDVMDRREAVRRAVLLVGGTLSAPAVAAALARGAAAQAAGASSAPGALTPEQLEQVATIAEHIIPATDTPGARAAGVHRFVDVMMTEYYTPAERQRFLAGLAEVEARARREHGKSFLASSAAQQRRLLEQIDEETLPGGRQIAAATAASKETERGGGGLVASGGADDHADASNLRFFFRTMKDLTIVGYYTSQPGATKELRYVQVPGRFDGCVPLTKIGRSWAT